MTRKAVADLCPVPLTKSEATTAADFFDHVSDQTGQGLSVANSLIRLNAEAIICRKGKL
ncbi:hypothetical protein ACXHXM_34075